MPFEMTMTMFWLIAMVFFLVVEAVTVGLVCIWFAAGSRGSAVRDAQRTRVASDSPVSHRFGGDIVLHKAARQEVCQQ